MSVNAEPSEHQKRISAAMKMWWRRKREETNRMTDDDVRDFIKLVAMIPPGSIAGRDEGIAALHRLFHRWHREAHEPGDRHQRPKKDDE